MVVGCLEFNVPFQHKYGYIRDESTMVDTAHRLWMPLLTCQQSQTVIWLVIKQHYAYILNILQELSSS